LLGKRSEEILKLLWFNSEVQKLKAQFELVSIHLGVADVFEAKDCLKDHFIIKTSLNHAGAKVDDDLIPLLESEHPLFDVGDELVVINV